MATLFSKLQYKGSDTILLINAPDGFKPQLVELGDNVTIETTIVGKANHEFALVFITSCAEIAQLAAPVLQYMTADGVLWFAYPKKSSRKYKTDLSRDDGWQPLGQVGYEPVRQIAIDEDWSALRFRHVQNIKSLTRSFAMTEEGKARTTKATTDTGR